MKNIKKLVARGLIIGVVAGLFVGDIVVCNKIGVNMKENKVAAEYKARDREYKIGFADKVGQSVENEKAQKQAKEQLKKDLEEDYQIHKNDKPVQSTTKKLTKEEKENQGRG